MIALDKDRKRLARVTENVLRLGIDAPLSCIAADASDTAIWWDKQPFDRILLDAPCSAIGVIRRHPDIKVLRQPADIITLPSLQYALLCALWPTLKPGGILLYATCSILPGENQQVIARFLQQHADAKEKPIIATWGIDTSPVSNCCLGKLIKMGFSMHD